MVEKEEKKKEKEPVDTKAAEENESPRKRHSKKADAADTAGSDDPIEALEKKLEAAQEEARENYDRLLRVTAEFENYKKRTEREKEEFRKFANESILKEILILVDNLERAVSSSGNQLNSDDCVVEGVSLTINEIMKVFDKFSVKPIDALNQTFDPNVHEAVMQEATDDHPDNTVIKEFQKGYMIHDRLLRPAMVAVSKAKNDTDADGRDEGEKENI